MLSQTDVNINLLTYTTISSLEMWLRKLRLVMTLIFKLKIYDPWAYINNMLKLLTKLENES